MRIEFAALIALPLPWLIFALVCELCHSEGTMRTVLDTVACDFTKFGRHHESRMVCAALSRAFCVWTISGADQV